MKPMNEIATLQEIDSKRAVLLKQLHKQEHVLRRDYNRIEEKWNRWLNIGSLAGDFALSFMPKMRLLSSGWELIKKIFSKK